MLYEINIEIVQVPPTYLSIQAKLWIKNLNITLELNGNRSRSHFSIFPSPCMHAADPLAAFGTHRWERNTTWGNLWLRLASYIYTIVFVLSPYSSLNQPFVWMRLYTFKMSAFFFHAIIKFWPPKDYLIIFINFIWLQDYWLEKYNKWSNGQALLVIWIK